MNDWRATIENLSTTGWALLLAASVAVLYAVAWTIERLWHYYRPTRAPELRGPRPVNPPRGRRPNP